MKRFRKFAALAVLAILALSLMPARAASYKVEYGALEKATFKVKLAGGGSAEVTLTELQGVFVQVDSTTQRPQPITIDNFSGCIKVTTSLGTDQGCGPLQGAALDTATLVNGTVLFSVKSSKFPGNQYLFATLFLEGWGAPTPGDTPAVSRAGSTTTLTSGPTVKRGMFAKGIVRSESVGGGSVQLTEDGWAYVGLGGLATVTAP